MMQQDVADKPQIRITPEVHREFKVFCARRGLLMSQVACDALLEYIVKREDQERFGLSEEGGR